MARREEIMGAMFLICAMGNFSRMVRANSSARVGGASMDRRSKEK